MDLLFSSTDATGGPGPRRFEAIFGAGTIDSVVLHITYWARRNADLFRGATATGRDDLVRVDYNTRDVIDASVKLSEYADYVDDGSGNLTLPPPERTPKQASLSDTIIVRNAAR
jgi:hypothetical protein